MKTFEEAMEMVCPVVGNEEVESAMQAAVAFHKKYSEIARDVMNHRGGFVLAREAVIVAVGRDGLDVRSALLTVFMMGLQCGVEMEKEEIREPVA